MNNCSRLIHYKHCVTEINENELILNNFGDRLGSGSTGSVYKGIWKKRDRKTVAVKVFHDLKVTDIKREMSVLYRCNHGNIIKLHGKGKTSIEQEYIVLECANKYNLHDVIFSKQVYGLCHALNWIMQISSALAYLHKRTIFHRDVKPSNCLLFNDYDLLKLSDFGLAKHIETQNTRNIGTMRYMSPEMLEDESNVTVSCDVYSWSITAWEIFKREKAYGNINKFRLMRDCIEGVRPLKIDGLPEMLWNMLEKSWDGVPENRPRMESIYNFMKNLVANFENPDEKEFCLPYFDSDCRQKSSGEIDAAREEAINKLDEFVPDGDDIYNAYLMLPDKCKIDIFLEDDPESMEMHRKHKELLQFYVMFFKEYQQLNLNYITMLNDVSTSVANESDLSIDILNTRIQSYCELKYKMDNPTDNEG